MPAIRRHAAARRDLIEHAAYLMEHAGEATADRFLAHAQESFGLLLEQPMIGSAVPVRNPTLHDLRKWAVRGFGDYLIFYRPRSQGITIVRVLHSSTDWWRLLGFERE
jgi:toxin ParE1/3/4